MAAIDEHWHLPTGAGTGALTANLVTIVTFRTRLDQSMIANVDLSISLLPWCVRATGPALPLS